LSSLVVPEPRPDGVLLSRLVRLPDDRALDLLGVRYVIANSGVPPRAGLPMAVDFGDLAVFARANPVARDLVVFNATTAPNDDATLARMAEPSFDPAREVVLNESVALGGGEPITVEPDVRT